MPPPNREAFIEQMLPYAERWSQATGIPAEVFIAIGASETNWGNAGSLFGIKGVGPSGKSANYATHEVVNGQRVNVNDQFAIYDNPDEAFQHFVGLISSGRYAPAWDHLQATGDWQGFLQGINRAGYATDPGWGNMIANLSHGVADAIGKVNTIQGGAPAMPATNAPEGLPQGAELIGNNLARWLDPTTGEFVYFRNNPSPYLDVITNNIVPAGWVSTGTLPQPNAAKTPAEQAKNIRVNQTTGKAYVVDNQGNIVRPAPEFDERPQTEGKQPQLSQAAVLRQSIGGLGQQGNTPATSSASKEPSEGDVILGRERTIPVSPQMQESIKSVYGDDPYRRNVYAEQFGGVGSPAYNDISKNPALGNPLMGQDVYSYDMSGKKTFGGGWLPTPGGGSMMLLPGNMNAFSAAAFGTTPSGDPLKDFNAGASALTKRSLYSEANPEMSPDQIQTRFFDVPGGFDRQKEALQQAQLSQALALLKPYSTPEDEGQTYPYDPIRGYATGTDEDEPIVAGVPQFQAPDTSGRFTPAWQDDTTASDARLATARGLGTPRYTSDGLMIRGRGNDAAVMPMTGAGDWQRADQAFIPNWQDYLEDFWNGVEYAPGSREAAIQRALFQDIFTSWGKKNGRVGPGITWRGSTPQPWTAMNGRTYNINQGGVGAAHRTGAQSFFGIGSYAGGTASPIVAGMPEFQAPQRDWFGGTPNGAPGFQTQGPLAMVDMSTGQTRGIAGEAGPEAISVTPLHDVQSSLAYLKALAKGRDRAIKLALPAGAI